MSSSCSSAVAKLFELNVQLAAAVLVEQNVAFRSLAFGQQNRGFHLPGGLFDDRRGSVDEPFAVADLAGEGPRAGTRGITVLPGNLHRVPGVDQFPEDAGAGGGVDAELLRQFGNPARIRRRNRQRFQHRQCFGEHFDHFLISHCEV